MKNLKSILLFALVSCFTLQLSAQKSVEQVLRKYKNDEGVLAMNLTGDFISFLDDNSDHKLNSEIAGVDIIMFNNGKNISDGDWSQIKSALTNENYEMLINVRESGKNAKVYTIENGDFISKLFAHVNADGKNIYFILSGKIKYDDLHKLSMDFEGGDIFKHMDGGEREHKDHDKKDKKKKDH